MVSVDLKSGVYIVAVSGGVDSMVLLDVVRQLPNVRLIVVHVNHGIRKDATEDAKLVQAYAMSHNLVYESTDLHLGASASEEQARQGRYAFLRHVCNKYNALAIITAHHRDDLLETAIFNMMRGTGWRGLSSLRSTDKINRPFLHIPKATLEAYAAEHNLDWRHDSTNDDRRYARNRIRHELLAKAPLDFKEKLYQYIVRQNELTQQIDTEAALWLDKYVGLDSPALALPRYAFIMMPPLVASELLQHVLRRKIGTSIVRPLAEDALLFIKVAKRHKTFSLNARWQLRIQHGQVIVEERSTVVSLDNAGVQKDHHLNKDYAF